MCMWDTLGSAAEGVGNLQLHSTALQVADTVLISRMADTNPQSIVQ